jgi:hypothetical protein
MLQHTAAVATDVTGAGATACVATDVTGAGATACVAVSVQPLLWQQLSQQASGSIMLQQFPQVAARRSLPVWWSCDCSCDRSCDSSCASSCGNVVC